MCILQDFNVVNLFLVVQVIILHLYNNFFYVFPCHNRNKLFENTCYKTVMASVFDAEFKALQSQTQEARGKVHCVEMNLLKAATH